MPRAIGGSRYRTSLTPRRTGARGGQRVARSTRCRASATASGRDQAPGASSFQDAHRFGLERLRREGLHAEQVQRVAVVRPVAHREIAADGEDEVAAAHREERAAVLHHERAMHVGDDVLRVSGHRIAAIRRGEIRVVAIRREDRLVRARAPSGGPASPPRRRGPRSRGPDPTSRRAGCEGSRGPRGIPCPRARRSTRGGPRPARPRARPPPRSTCPAPARRARRPPPPTRAG